MCFIFYGWQIMTSSIEWAIWFWEPTSSMISMASLWPNVCKISCYQEGESDRRVCAIIQSHVIIILSWSVSGRVVIHWTNHEFAKHVTEKMQLFSKMKQLPSCLVNLPACSFAHATFPTNKDPFQTRLIKDILQTWIQRLKLCTCHGGCHFVSINIQS